MIVLIFYTESGIDGSYLLFDFLLGMVRHVWGCPKCSQTTNCQYLGKELSDCVSFCMQSDIHERYKLILLFQLDVGTHTMVY